MALTTTQSAVVAWLAHDDDTGRSSEAMAFYLGFGILRENNGKAHPLDPADFHRCVNLLRKAPGLRKKLHKMAKLSPEWKNLVAAWDDLEAELKREVGAKWRKNQSARAPKTYEMMRKLLDCRVEKTSK